MKKKKNICVILVSIIYTNYEKKKRKFNQKIPQKKIHLKLEVRLRNDELNFILRAT